MSSANQILDRIQSFASIATLEADPRAYATQLAAEISPANTLAELEARDAQLTAALRHIDETTSRVMRLRLEQVLAADTAIGVPTRKVFAATVLDYANDLARLSERTRDLAARGHASNPDDIATRVVDAARASLALRTALRAGVLAMVRDLSTATIPDADRQAKDRTLPDVQRTQWSAARRDLEILAADPDRILAAPMAARLAAWPEQIDEPPAEAERTFADMIELD